MGAQMLGIVPTEVQTAADFTANGSLHRLGTVSGYDSPTYGYQEFVWGRANGAYAVAGLLGGEATTFDFAPVTVTTTTAGTAGYGTRCGVAQSIMADNDYGWFQIYGAGKLQTLLSAAKGTRLNTTATVGQVDDDAGSGSEAIFGLVLLTATDGSATLNTDARMTYPTVGTTL